MTTRRSVLVVSGVLLGVLLVSGGIYAHWAHVDYRFEAISPGKLYKSAAMPPEELLRTVERHGIRTVIDLRHPDPAVDSERRALAEGGVAHVHIPSEQIPHPQSVERFLEVVGRPENLPVLVHCRHGQGRASLYSAIYRIELEQWEPERARRSARMFTTFGSFARGGDKGRFLLEYRNSREHVGPSIRPVANPTHQTPSSLVVAGSVTAAEQAGNSATTAAALYVLAVARLDARHELECSESESRQIR